ncbi:hypothetical protein IBTHAUMO2_470025 [Nitrosopumilaceae archaeon]|nr:hypothetical protein IBTHAUMO2_470025 [Nitrosopumilaceae archaeon]
MSSTGYWLPRPDHAPGGPTPTRDQPDGPPRPPEAPDLGTDPGPTGPDPPIQRSFFPSYNLEKL